MKIFQLFLIFFTIYAEDEHLNKEEIDLTPSFHNKSEEENTEKTSSHNFWNNYRPFVKNNEVENTENAHDFDINIFLDEIGKHDCHRGHDIATGKELKDEECLKKLSQDVFKGIGQADQTYTSLYNSLKDNIFKPLNLKIKNNINIPTILRNLITSKSNQEKDFSKMNFTTSYGVFS